MRTHILMHTHTCVPSPALPPVTDDLPQWVQVTVEDTNVRMRYPTRAVFVVNHVRGDAESLRALTSELLARSWRECLVELVRCQTLPGYVALSRG